MFENVDITNSSYDTVRRCQEFLDKEEAILNNIDYEAIKDSKEPISFIRKLNAWNKCANKKVTKSIKRRDKSNIIKRNGR